MLWFTRFVIKHLLFSVLTTKLLLFHKDIHQMHQNFWLFWYKHLIWCQIFSFICLFKITNFKCVGKLTLLLLRVKYWENFLVMFVVKLHINVCVKRTVFSFGSYERSSVYLNSFAKICPYENILEWCICTDVLIIEHQ